MNMLNEDLEKAVIEDDYKKVRALLYRGANANRRLPKINIDYNDTLLHRTTSVEVTRELLLHGASVNSLNKYKQTPLHSATMRGKKFELIRELLKNGAHVNARSRIGNTPLYYAVKRKKMLIIKLLIQYGAYIEITSLSNCKALLDKYPFGRSAGGDVAIAKEVMKVMLLKKFESKGLYQNLHFYLAVEICFFCQIGYYNFSANEFKVHGYSQKCIEELFDLQRDQIIDCVPLYEFLITKNLYLTPTQAQTKLNSKELLTRYPIYHKIIFDKLKSCIKRPNLIGKLRELQFYTRSTKTLSNQDVEETKVILNVDSLCNIAKYICNDDLENLITALYYGTNPLDFSNYGELLRPDQTLENEGVCDSPSPKRTKFDL